MLLELGAASVTTLEYNDIENSVENVKRIHECFFRTILHLEDPCEFTYEIEISIYYDRKVFLRHIAMRWDCESLNI